MRHLPNLLTLANLLCGCLAVVCVLNAQPFLFQDYDHGSPEPNFKWAYGIEQIQWGGILIFCAALFDLLDGFTARALKVFSPIGADLDSLADVVSFGVAPSAILYKLLWDCITTGSLNDVVIKGIAPQNPDVSQIMLVPAFAIAIFAAIRLAQFNVSANQKSEFKGMPTPAVGLLIASFALISWDFPPKPVYLWLFRSIWALYGLIALLCWLMVSNIRFLKLMPSVWKPAKIWPQLIVVIGALVAIPFMKFGAVAAGFVLYVLVSLIAPKEDAPAVA